MATTLTTVDNILKEVYEERLIDQLQSEITTLRRIERSSEGVTQDAVGGKYTTFPVRVKRNHGIGARSEMEALPNPKTQDYRAARINLKYLYGAIQLSGQTFELAQTNRQSFASALEQEVNGMRETLAKDTNRQVYGTSVGILATANAAGTTTTFVTDNAQYVEIGMIIDVWDATGPPPAASVSEAEVTDVEETSPGVWTITFTPAAGGATASGWTLTRHGSRTKEKTGFDQILNTSGDFDTLYNITHSIWTANIDDTSGALSEGRMINMIHDIRRRGGTTTVGFCSLGVQRAYFNLLVQQRRFTNTKTFEGGFTGLAFTVDNADIPIIPDFDCQPGRLYFMNEKAIKLYQSGEWSFMDRDGSRWARVHDANGDYDAYRARLYKYCELGTHRRNTHGVLTNVTEA